MDGLCNVRLCAVLDEGLTGYPAFDGGESPHQLPGQSEHSGDDDVGARMKEWTGRLRLTSSKFRVFSCTLLPSTWLAPLIKCLEDV